MTDAAHQIFSGISELIPIEPTVVAGWGKTLIIAPHPDDESLGCGGAIALLRKMSCEVIVLTISDGTLSHPNSQKFPAEKLLILREMEMKSALRILGVDEDKISFLRFRDRHVPSQDAPDFAAAIKTIQQYLIKNKPQTILAPWRRDPHPDHQASWQLVSAAATANKEISYRILEYPIWLWEMAEKADLPGEKNIKIYGLRIDEVVAQKQAAIFAHKSQTTDLINDDPRGFRLSHEVLAHFETPLEVYLEEIK